MITKEVTCGDCPGMCCYSLNRSNNGRFINPGMSGSACNKLSTTCRCSIHETLREISPGCESYSCFGGGLIIARIFQLEPEKACNDVRIQGIFILCQNIMNALWELQEFIRRFNDEDNTEIQSFLDKKIAEMKLFNKETSPLIWAQLEMEISMMLNALRASRWE